MFRDRSLSALHRFLTTQSHSAVVKRLLTKCRNNRIFLWKKSILISSHFVQINTKILRKHRKISCDSRASQRAFLKRTEKILIKYK